MWIALGIVAGFVAFVVLIGAMTPRQHTATCKLSLRAAPATVWQLITDWQRLPQWRRELRAVEPLEGGGWVEISKFGRMPMRIEQQQPERLLVLRLADEQLPFGGTWTFRLEPRPDGGTELAVTEDGSIRPILFRAMARTVFGYHKTLEGYLRSLAQRLGEEALPIRE